MAWIPMAVYTLLWNLWARRRGLPTLCSQARTLAARHPDVRAAMVGIGVAFIAHVLNGTEVRPCPSSACSSSSSS